MFSLKLKILSDKLFLEKLFKELCEITDGIHILRKIMRDNIKIVDISQDEKDIISKM